MVSALKIKRDRQKPIRGFTLTEALIVLAIVSILGSFMQPNLGLLMEKYRSRVAQQTLLQVFKDARVDAISNKIPVVICGSSDGTNCDKDWDTQLLLFRDTDGDHMLTDADVLLYKRSLTNKETKVTSYRRYFRVRTMGNLASHPDSIRYCSEAGLEELNWRAVINRVGRVRIDKRESDGKPIKCGTS